MKELNLPIGLQDFEQMRNKNFLYVDKTEMIYRLIKTGSGSFLSRPRRFGKSILVSTFDAIFSGKKDLFDGLYIGKSDYSWKEYQVINLDFSRIISSKIGDISLSLQEILMGISRKFGLSNVKADHPSFTLTRIVEELSKKSKVVILIDEYDKPLVHHFDDPETLSHNREVLRDFFMAIKSLSSSLHYVFVTGVSKFTKVSLFSGMNNLDDISLDSEYCSIAGLTELEIKDNLKNQINKVSKFRQESYEETFNIMRKWYNGYRFYKTGSGDLIYNPLSVMQFLRKYRLDNFWFSTATPTFAIELIKKKEFPVIRFEEGTIAGKEIEESHEIDSIDLTTLLYQTGYLTIKKYDNRTQFYHLGFPNEEVRQSFLEHLLHGFSGIEATEVNNQMFSISKALEEENLEDFVSSLNVLFSSAPYQLHIKKEAYYHSLIYLVLRALGFRVDAEVCTSKGRIDMILQTKEKIFIFEFKIDCDVKKGIDQILNQSYQEKFSLDPRKIILVSIVFSSKSRSISGWEVLTLGK